MTEVQVPDGVELVALQDARKRLSDLVHRAWLGDGVTFLGKHGRPIAAIVPVEAARSRAQLAASAELSTAELDELRAGYERLNRAADAVLDADEVLWVRAYLRLWDLLQHMDGAFEAALEDAWAAEHAAERDRAAGQDSQNDDDAGWTSDDAYYGDPYRGELRRLRQQERARVDFARQIDYEVEARLQADVRHPGRGELLDWHAWTSRIDKLAKHIAAARAAGADQPLMLGARDRLRDALAETAAMLNDLKVTGPAEPPADVTDYLAREIWTEAAHVPAGPLIVTIAAFVKGSHLPAEAVRRALGELRKSGRISCYRYFRGQQVEIDPTQLIPEAQFHLVLHGQLDGLDTSHIRPVIVADL